MLSSPKRSRHQTLVSMDHTWPPSGPPSASPGPPAFCTSPIPHSCAYQMHAAGSTPLQAVEIFVGTQRPSAAPGSSVRTHQAHLPGHTHRVTSASTPAPVWHKEVQAPPSSLSAPEAKAFPCLDSPDLTGISVFSSHFSYESPPSPAHGIFI